MHKPIQRLADRFLLLLAPRAVARADYSIKCFCDARNLYVKNCAAGACGDCYLACRRCC